MGTREEDDPDRVIERMAQLVEETSPRSEETSSLDDGGHPIARKHRDAIRRGARTTETDGE
ncbi:hypothetical protein [Haloterrigena alkaliphila]|uniref:Uncharacterized protein n=1 Tax=Haloterrigena alkaliphila TaxID=2816475 RepID=A0A8A2VBJ4_9EURY|nr:hypothetical protein [Haloterrigena alkaliphila]QSW99429.1 hypothetical protein J0X25_00280 [Haloterrigena alkaliphila]